ncbi:MAG: ATP-binding protein [Phycisphaerae bacterium]
MITVLLVDRIPDDRNIVHKILAAHPSWEIDTADSTAEVVQILEERGAAILLVDLAVAQEDDGAFVRKIRQTHRDVPIVVMTPNRAEDAIVKTLMLGAANYVPRSDLARDLITTLERLLALSGTGTSDEALLNCIDRQVTEFTLPNQRRLVAPMVDFLQKSLIRLAVCGPDDRVRVGTALEEALVNAIIHGNLEVESSVRERSQAEYEALIAARRMTKPYCDRRVYVRAEITSTAAVFTIRDEGPGFDMSAVPDPTDLANLMRVCGRGLLLMRAFSDEMHHTEKGNEVTLVKKRTAISDPAE